MLREFELAVLRMHEMCYIEVTTLYRFSNATDSQFLRINSNGRNSKYFNAEWLNMHSHVVDIQNISRNRFIDQLL